MKAIFFLCLVLIAAAAVPAVSSDAGEISGDLQVQLSLDKEAFAVGEEIRFRIIFVNKGLRAFRIFVPNAFWGEELLIRDSAGHEISKEGGYATFSPKVNLFMGTTRTLQPGASFDLRLESWLDDRFRLVFGGMERSAPLGAEQRKRLGVPDNYPDKYIASGRIFPLARPGRYQATFRYVKSEADRNWRISGEPQMTRELLSDIWVGTVESNTVTFQVR